MYSHLPKEQQTAYQRWEMTSFGDERPSVVAAREAAQAAQAAAEAAEQALLDAIAIEPEAAPEAEAAPLVYPTAAELEALREQAQQEGYETGLKEGHAEGRAAGLAEALAEGRAASTRELEQLLALARQFSAATAQADELIAGEVLELALQLAKGMLTTALRVQPELILPIVRQAIDNLPSLQQPALLLLHPDDAALVRDGIGDDLTKSGWRIVEDAQIGRGGCRIDTASNQIDAQASARWQRLTHALGTELDWLAP